MRPLKRVVIKEELVALTGDYRPALILNQFIYWIERMYDADKYIKQEKERALKEDLTVDIDETCGWIYKTAEELSEELMIGMSKSTIGRYIKQLVEAGYINQRTNPKYKWDKTLQYRVNLYKVQLDLAKLGYALEGYKLLPNIEIKEDLEIDIEVKEENKKAPTVAPAEAKDNLEKQIDNNIIPRNNKKYSLKNMENKNKTGKGASANVNDNFKKYDADELEKMLFESQKDKFKPSYPYKTETKYTKDGQRIDIG